MSAEKYEKLISELPTARHQEPALTPIRRRSYRRIVAKCAVASVASIWLFSHYHENRGSWLQGHNGHHGIRGKEAEELFLSVPNAASAIAASRQFATTPHLAGSDGDLSTAKDFLAVLQKNLGIEIPSEEPIFPAGTINSRDATLQIPNLDAPAAWIDIYYPVMNTPLDRGVEILDENGKSVWTAQLEEFSDETDPEAAKYYTVVPAFHGFSKDGEAEGQLIDAKNGLKEDYDALAAAGVNFTGKIVMARYNENLRGLKVKGAQELGAAGVLIYSDTSDDGTVTEENGYAPYPYGPARNKDSLQRGSVQFISMYPGDPTTPGIPSYENATRTEGENIPSIPSLPISWANAQVLLKEIAEGGANRTIKLVNHVDNRVTPIWNTMGVIPGHIKDEVVVIGNHRDAWVMGASDPTSGTASLHEVIRGFGVLMKEGWKPLRTIVIASWDAEEYGLIGSTEWGEDFEEFIQNHVVAYLNLDVSVAGSRYTAQASPSFAHLVRDTANEIAHPTDIGRTLWDARKDRGTFFGNSTKAQIKQLFEDDESELEGFGVGTLGSGSDFTVFLQRLGIASLNMAFDATNSDPIYHYHSVFDSERWMELYGDPGFVRHVAVAKHLGLQTLRLADSIILPINTTHYAYELESYLELVENLAVKSYVDISVDFSPLRNSIIALQTASSLLDKEKAEAEHELESLLLKWRHKRVIRRKLWKAWCKIRKALGKDCHRHHKDSEHSHHGLPSAKLATLQRGETPVEFKPRIGRFPGWMREQEGKKCGLESKEHPHKGHFPSHSFLHAVKHVQAVNKKLSTFEQGFISEGGIKDREWYRHLGVAPGKWLGYGATTFPALTEAFTIEKNGTLARYEAERLRSMIDDLAKGLSK